MRVEKTKFSTAVWVLYGIAVLFFSANVFKRAFTGFLMPDYYGYIALAIVLGLTILLTALGRKKGKTVNTGVITIILSVLFIAGGIFLRIRNLWDAGAVKALTDWSQIPFYPTELSGGAGISGSFFAALLEFVFFVFGNFGETIIIVNTVLSVVAAVCLFFASRRLGGNFSSAAVTGFFMLSPFSVEACRTGGAEILVLVFESIALLFVADFIMGERQKFVSALFTGVFIGVCVSMDITALSLLLCMPMFFICLGLTPKKENRLPAGKLVGCFGILVISMVIGYAFSLFLFTGITNTDFFEVFTAFPDRFVLFGNNCPVDQNTDLISAFLLSVLLILGIPAGFFQKGKDPGSSIALIMTGALAAFTCGFSELIDAKGLYVFVLLAMLAGNTTDNLTYREVPVKVLNIKSTGSETTGVNKPENPVSESGEKEDKLGTGTVKKLDNPLPVPEHKSRDKVDYDYYVPENADYDY
ncbi:MAG: hypothetical protein IJ796_07140 [Lachnospiraceae bacterium]|nr:hypothetical protein [Lachnospiraceae bacterium]